MDPLLQRYLGFAIGRVSRIDFLHALDKELSDSLMENVYQHSHNIWDAAILGQVSNRCLVRRGDETYRIIPIYEVIATDIILPNKLKPCNIYVQENGGFSFEFTRESTNFWMYERGDPLNIKEH